ncbi:MAG: hypothetical protein SOX13_07350 [Sodaliphilus sp.]|nr:hypothetical protein [Sodaliphilus sp.]
MVKNYDATTTDRLRRSPLYLVLSPSCARKRACMELTTTRRFQRLSTTFSVLSKYHVPTGFGFSPKARGFYPFGDATALAGEGGVGDVVWLIQASA